MYKQEVYTNLLLCILLYKLYFYVCSVLIIPFLKDWENDKRYLDMNSEAAFSMLRTLGRLLIAALHSNYKLNFIMIFVTHTNEATLNKMHA